MKRIRNNVKLIVGIIIGTLIASVTVYAATMLAEDVSFSNTKSGLTATNVQDAIDEIYVAKGLNHYKETILNGADPVYSENLIPVKIASNGTVTKADVTKQWYKYEDKEWANVVMLNDYTVEYSNGATIPSSNIKAYFVWIPKYSYQIFDLGNYTSTTSSKPSSSIAHTINIKFGTTNTSDSNTGECTTPKTAGATGNCTVGKYMTHPAFLTMNSNGLWVGKFETTGSITNPTVLPGQSSLRNITVKNMFEAGYNYDRLDDSHMMKNTEWGAVAYLSLSKYGINGEIRINNNSNYLTGYSAVDGTDQSSYPGTYGTDSTKTLAYNTTTGYKASTTGNISGIYDMAGGAHEYMASYMSGTYGSSGFASTDTYMGSAYSKYFDIYPSDSSTTTYNKRILGDATGEMGPFYSYKEGDNGPYNHNNWYADYSYFVMSSSPWFYRGGHYNFGVLAGQLYFGRHTGEAYGSIGFRLVLAD